RPRGVQVAGDQQRAGLGPGVPGHGQVADVHRHLRPTRDRVDLQERVGGVGGGGERVPGGGQVRTVAGEGRGAVLGGRAGGQEQAAPTGGDVDEHDRGAGLPSPDPLGPGAGDGGAVRGQVGARVAQGYRADGGGQVVE